MEGSVMGTSGERARVARLDAGLGGGHGLRRQQPVLGLPGGVGEPLAHDGLAALGEF